MNVIVIIVRILALICLGALLICGLYLSGLKTPIDPGSIQFHMTIGIAGIAVSLVTFFLPGKRAKQ